MKKNFLPLFCISVFLFLSIFMITTLHHEDMFFYPQVNVDTFNSELSAKIICYDNAYYKYQKKPQKGVYRTLGNESTFLFESEEIISLTMLNESLIALSRHNLYIFNCVDNVLEIKNSNELQMIFDTIGVTEEIGFFNSYRLCASENTVRLYCFEDSDIFRPVKSFVIYPVFDKESLKNEIYFQKDYTISQMLVLINQTSFFSENPVLIAVEPTHSNEINYNLFPIINEHLYKRYNNTTEWGKIYSSKKYEKIVFCNDEIYVIYNLKNNEYVFYDFFGTVLKTSNQKKLKYFNSYTYNLCNNQLFVLDKNYNIYDIVSIDCQVMVNE